MDTGVNDGTFNMSCDNFLLDSISNNSIKLPLLRVYGWTKPTLSIGANQTAPPFTAGPVAFRYPPDFRHIVPQSGRLPSGATRSE